MAQWPIRLPSLHALFYRGFTAVGRENNRICQDISVVSYMIRSESGIHAPPWVEMDIFRRKGSAAFIKSKQVMKVFIRSNFLRNQILDGVGQLQVKKRTS